MSRTRRLLAAGKRIALRRAHTPMPARRARRATPRAIQPSIDDRLAWIAMDVLAGKHVDCAWELLRQSHFPDWPHERIAAALGAWSTPKGIKVTFEGRTVNDRPVIWVFFRR